MKRQASDPLLPTRSTKYQRTEVNQGIVARWYQLGADAFTLARETARHIMNCEIRSIVRYDRRLTIYLKYLKTPVNLKPRLNGQKSTIALALSLPGSPTQPYLVVYPYLKSSTNPQTLIQWQGVRNFRLLCHPDQNPPMHSVETRPHLRQRLPGAPRRKPFNPTTS